MVALDHFLPGSGVAADPARSSSQATREPYENPAPVVPDDHLDAVITIGALCAELRGHRVERRLPIRQLAVGPLIRPDGPAQVPAPTRALPEQGQAPWTLTVQGRARRAPGSRRLVEVPRRRPMPTQTTPALGPIESNPSAEHTRRR